MRLEVVDWNGDGLPDVLIGNGDGTILFYQGYCFRLAPPARLAADEGILEWTSALYLRYHVLGGPSPEVLRTIVGSNVLSAGEVTRWTNRWAGERQFFRIQVAP
jgi:hypothetical protein